MSSLIVSKLTDHIGGFVSGIELSDYRFSESQSLELRQALEKYQILLFRGVPLSPENQVNFTRIFGQVEKFPYRPSQLVEFPEIFRLSTDGQEGYTNVGFYWHQDGSFSTTPSSKSIFHMIKAPSTGGDTLFANAYLAYDMIPDDLKQVAYNAKTVHGNGVVHDLVIIHPISKKRALYINTGLVQSITGVKDEDRGKVKALALILETSMDDPSVMYRHKWREGDLIVCDNYSVLHKATIVNNKETRILHRTSVAGSLTLNRT